MLTKFSRNKNLESNDEKQVPKMYSCTGGRSSAGTAIRSIGKPENRPTESGSIAVSVRWLHRISKNSGQPVAVTVVLDRRMVGSTHIV